MTYPSPRAALAGCIWLPRLLAKARLLNRGELPADYEARFCHPTGVDGQFLAHFGLTRDEVLTAARLSDDEVTAWFTGRFSPSQIAAWNEMAPNFGRPGYPMADRLPVALATSYAHLADRGLTTVFDVLEADELPPPHEAPPPTYHPQVHRP